MGKKGQQNLGEHKFEWFNVRSACELCETTVNMSILCISCLDRYCCVECAAEVHAGEDASDKTFQMCARAIDNNLLGLSDKQ